MLAAIARVCDSQSYILGPEVEALEREIGELTGAGHAVGCASGTEALWLALVAAGVKPGEAVITTALSFFASASAIVRAGATPVFVDVDPGTLNLDPALVERTLREWKAPAKTSAGTRPERFGPYFPYIFMASALIWMHSSVLFANTMRAIRSFRSRLWRTRRRRSAPSGTGVVLDRWA